MSVKVAWITFVAVVAYVISVDANILRWIYLSNQRVNIWGHKLWFYIWHSPGSPVRRVLIQRNADRMAKEFIEEFYKEGKND